jgi:hypothetical protein
MKTTQISNNFAGYYWLTLLVAAALLFLGGQSAYAQYAFVATNDNSGVQCEILKAGQTIDAGTVCAEIVGDNLEITFTTTNGWQLKEAHLWTGGDLADMPQTRKGNPKIGNFPYNSGDITGSTSHTFMVPLNTLGVDCSMNNGNSDYYVAAHAALRKVDVDGNVIQTETGWADGSTFVDKGSWATYFTLTISCKNDPPEPKCETAFGYGDTYANDFLLIDENGDGSGDFNRWGWSNGPLSAGSYTFDIYAGAGQSDITKGTLVGSLSVDYDGSTATVTFNMNLGFSMNETHLYVGSEILARDVNNQFTVAPGQYPYIHDDNDFEGVISDSYTVMGLSGDIYVVAHAVVCGDFE